MEYLNFLIENNIKNEYYKNNNVSISVKLKEEYILSENDLKIIILNEEEKFDFDFNKNILDNSYTLNLSNEDTQQLNFDKYKIYFNIFNNVNNTYETFYFNTILFKEDVLNNNITKTHAKKTLEALETLIEGKALNDAINYTINGRSISKMSIESLLKWRDYYKQEVEREQKQEDIKNGVYKNKSKIRIYFKN